jgi:hypothetical protein
VPDLLEVDIEGMAEQVEATAKAASVLGKMNTPSRKYHPHFKCMYLRLLAYLLHRFVPPQVRVDRRASDGFWRRAEDRPDWSRVIRERDLEKSMILVGLTLKNGS